MTTPTDERAAFEAAMLAHGIMPATLERCGDGYTFLGLPWVAWQAARAQPVHRAVVDTLIRAGETPEDAERLAQPAAEPKP